MPVLSLYNRCIDECLLQYVERLKALFYADKMGHLWPKDELGV
jgi:hypothetical protein